jgi:hypothetical protein
LNFIGPVFQFLLGTELVDKNIVHRRLNTTFDMKSKDASICPASSSKAAKAARRFSTRARVESNAGTGSFVVVYVDPASGAACLQPVASTRRFPVTLFRGPINSRYWK